MDQLEYLRLKELTPKQRYYRMNKAELLEKARIYREEHKVEYKEIHRAYYLRNKTKCDLANAKKRVKTRDALLKEIDFCQGCMMSFDDKIKPCIDHNHQKGKIRGLLCRSCNFALGFVKDNSDTLINLSEYLLWTK